MFKNITVFPTLAPIDPQYPQYYSQRQKLTEEKEQLRIVTPTQSDRNWEGNFWSQKLEPRLLLAVSSGEGSGFVFMSL